jgi:Flp pilus assembly secretin CpaC
MNYLKIVGLIGMLIAGCAIVGCNGGTGATQYTLDATANVTITPTAGAGASTNRDLQEQQIMIGTLLVEVTLDDAQQLGVELISMSLLPQELLSIDFQVKLDPQTTTSGEIFKLDPEGIPYGMSYLDLDLQVSSTTPDVEFEASTDVTVRDGSTVVIGGLQATADLNDRTQIPLLSDIPVINFLFRGQQHRAQISDLLIVLTPQIIHDTE